MIHLRKRASKLTIYELIQISKAQLSTKSTMVKLFYAGFDGFQQANNGKNCHDICLPTLIFENEPISFENVFLGWSRLMMIADKKVTVSGYWNGKSGFKGFLDCPGIQITQMTCTEHLAVAIDPNGKLWKLAIGETSLPYYEWLPVIINQREKTDQTDDEEGKVAAKFLKVSSNEHSVIALDECGNIYQPPLRLEDINSRFVDVACGKEHFIALSSVGTVFTWGSGSRGQLGHGSVESIDHPLEIEILGGIRIVQIAAGGWHSCALSESGDVYIWGWNESGQLGFPSRNASGSACTTQSDEHVSIQSEPRLLDGVIPFSASDVHVTSIGCGTRHTAVTLGNKSGWAWGWNGCGQLGTGDRQSHDTPVCVIQDVEKVVCGGWSTVWLSRL